MYDIFWYHARNPTIILQKKTRKYRQKPQLTVYNLSRQTSGHRIFVNVVKSLTLNLLNRMSVKVQNLF